MELNIRMLKDSDWNTLVEWWNAWPEWQAPAKEFLPDNGKGGFIVEKQNKPIVAGFLYTTNSKAALLEWIVSNPKYRENDRSKAIELLIEGAESVCKKQGIKYIFSIGRTQQLINTHKKLGYTVDEKPSHEIIKTL
tara:strand:- start:2895 stop:3302 length:408 start_codon:yes stop_codon:yes gene_type:complete